MLFFCDCLINLNFSFNSSTVLYCEKSCVYFNLYFIRKFLKCEKDVIWYQLLGSYFVSSLLFPGIYLYTALYVLPVCFSIQL